MEMEFINSSSIERIGYDSNSSTLRIEFKSNRTYDYFNVPEHVFHELRSASSVGGYHAKNIKNFFSYAAI